MPTEQVLKKKLKGVTTTRKISKAMKTVATVKYSQLSAVHSGYSEYATQCRKLYENCQDDFLKALRSGKSDGPVCYIIMASNKGMCGNFNADLFCCAENIISEEKGKKNLFSVVRKLSLILKIRGMNL